MTEKLDYYDLMAVFVPGATFLGWIAACYPDVVGAVRLSDWPEAISVAVFLAAAILTGHVIQAIASLIEPILHRTWGGRPSDGALRNGLGRYLSADGADRIRAKIAARLGPGASDHSLFLHAMQLTDAAGIGRCARFNSLYGYHRGLLVLLLLAIVALVPSRAWGAAAAWSTGPFLVALLGLVVLVVLIWYRTWQRSAYYTREVVLCAERVIDERDASTPRNGNHTTSTSGRTRFNAKSAGSDAE